MVSLRMQPLFGGVALPPLAFIQGRNTMLETTLDIARRDENFHQSPERKRPHPAIFMLMDAPGTTACSARSAGQSELERDRMRAIRTKMTIPLVRQDVTHVLPS
jgi:carboxymethylenebutenolidase